MIPNDYTVIDFETTGIDSNNDSILEMAAVRVRGGDIVDSFSSLVNPGVHISAKISQITGITDDMVVGSPSIQEVLPSFVNFIGDDILMGHNIRFDLRFLSKAYLNIIGPYYFCQCIDTLTIARSLYPDDEHHRLQDLARKFSINPDAAHRALSDVTTTHQCFQIMARDKRGASFVKISPFSTSTIYNGEYVGPDTSSTSHNSARCSGSHRSKANASVILQWIAAGLLLIFGLSTFPSFAPVFFILAALLAAPIRPLRDLLAVRGIRGWMIAAAAVVFTVLGFVVYPGR